MQSLLTNANIAIGKLDTMGYLAPNLSHIIAMYVRKEALLSSQIEGTQATLEDIFEYENEIPLKNANDVEEVVNYIKALKYGIQRLNDFPMSIRLIKETHAILMEGTRGKDKTTGEFKKSQNWIGPIGSTPSTTSFIPPPPKEAIDAMEELSTPYAIALLEYFVEKPHISIKDAASYLNLSYQSAKTHMQYLVNLEILKETRQTPR